jgi:hypothetical protein
MADEIEFPLTEALRQFTRIRYGIALVNPDPNGEKSLEECLAETARAIQEEDNHRRPRVPTVRDKMEWVVEHLVRTAEVIADRVKRLEQVGWEIHPLLAPELQDYTVKQDLANRLTTAASLIRRAAKRLVGEASAIQDVVLHLQTDAPLIQERAERLVADASVIEEEVGRLLMDAKAIGKRSRSGTEDQAEEQPLPPKAVLIRERVVRLVEHANAIPSGLENVAAGVNLVMISMRAEDQVSGI